MHDIVPLGGYMQTVRKLEVGKKCLDIPEVLPRRSCVKVEGGDSFTMFRFCEGAMEGVNKKFHLKYVF